ncbi:MAG: YlxR family protein [Firmicutes bacterium]|nr:YlxR family protein [Bacillota bacterium]
MDNKKTQARRKPIRTCIVCRTEGEKKALVRIVRTADGAEIDKTGRAAGRGAYLCGNPECRIKLVKTRALNRAFKAEISLECYAKINEELGMKGK